MYHSVIIKLYFFNDLAYYEFSQIADAKSLIALSNGIDFIKTFRRGAKKLTRL